MTGDTDVNPDTHTPDVNPDTTHCPPDDDDGIPTSVVVTISVVVTAVFVTFTVLLVVYLCLRKRKYRQEHEERKLSVPLQCSS